VWEGEGVRSGLERSRRVCKTERGCSSGAAKRQWVDIGGEEDIGSKLEAVEGVGWGRSRSRVVEQGV
jgi:hypothetical protein